MGDQRYVLIDTAGLRRRGKVEVGGGVRRGAPLHALQSSAPPTSRVLVIDALDGVTAQDAHVGGAHPRSYKGVVVVVNEVGRDREGQPHDGRVRGGSVGASVLQPWAPVPLLSSLTGQRVNRVLETVQLVPRRAETRRVPTGELNRLMGELIVRHAPPSRRSPAPRFPLRHTQPAVAPPTFGLREQPPPGPFHLPALLENKLREEYGFIG